MSHFAAQQYHTVPAAHSLPGRHLPLSPPETDHEASYTLHSSFVGAEPDLDNASAPGHHLGISSERSRFSQPRRTSTLSYQNRGARDIRDRGNPRGPKNLVVVIPPPDFPFEQVHLGHVLSMGPRHRLSQGILMPLFPSMFGQLNAIAREYNFPSTIGLCLYLHINENGITMTPRISDDSWQYLFGHLFDSRQASSGFQLPIGGSIEFDIDLNKARWFDSWVSGTLRDPEPAYPPVAPSSVAHHWRVESRTTDADEQAFEERRDISGSQTLVANSRPETLRHLPRKLSLVDRHELHVSHLGSKVLNQPNSPLETHLTHALSPIPQSAAVPQTAKSDLERRVHSWRESTELFTVSMSGAYQPAIDIAVPAVVTTMDEYALDRNFRSELNLDEYHWSVTSVGPNDFITEPPLPSPRPSSVHVDRRVNGSVPLTPATATSWGPVNEESHSVVSSVSRLPSPDLGERIVEDANAPKLRAVWGNSFGWRSASTWRGVYPYSRTHAKPVISVQLRDSRGAVSQYPNLVIYPPVSHIDSEHLKSSVWSVWGSSFGWSKAETWRKVWPYSATTQSAIPVRFCSTGSLEFKYPNLTIYPVVYPFLEIYPPCIDEDLSQPVSIALKGSKGLVTSYPCLIIYPAAYPHIDIYPPVIETTETNAQEQINMKLFWSDSILGVNPNLVIYPAVYPHFDLYPKTTEIVEKRFPEELPIRLANAHSLPPKYPNLDIYPCVYPYLDIYPSQETVHVPAVAPICVLMKSGERKPTSSPVWGVSFGWKSAKTWLDVYPLHIANKGHSFGSNMSIVKTTRAGRSAGNQAVWGISFGWNSAKTWRMVWPTSAVQTKSMPVQLANPYGLSSGYPHLVIYAAAYPHFDIYPARNGITEGKELQVENYEQSVALVPHYPSLTIYPAVYPHLDIYPPFSKILLTSDRGKGRENLQRRRIGAWRARTAAHIGLAALLTNNHYWEADEPLELDLGDYAWSVTSAGPSVSSPLQFHPSPRYPSSVHLDHRVEGSVLLTPSTATTWGPQDDDGYSDIISVEHLPTPDVAQRVLDDPENPFVTRQPWRLVWPFFRGESQTEAPSFTVLGAHYPNLVIYPAVYPHFNLYPSVDFCVEAPRMLPSDDKYSRVHVNLTALYPNLDIYPPCYPYNLDSIYPSIAVIDSAEKSPKTPCSYPWLVIYSPVYPFVTPYPDFTIEIEQPSKPIRSLPNSSSLQSINVKLSRRYPNFDLYPAGYPFCLESIYPSTCIDIDEPTSVALPSRYPCIEIYRSVYPFVQPYPQAAGRSEPTGIPGSLDSAAYTRAQGLLALAEYKSVDLYSTGYPHFDLYPAAIVEFRPTVVVQDTVAGYGTSQPPRIPTVTRRERKTHMELHVSVFRFLGKQPAQKLKTHSQLHDEVFQEGVVWTPSGYIQDLISLTPKRQEDVPMREPRRHPLPIPELTTAPVRPSRSRSGTITKQSPDKVVFPLGQPPALPPLSPLRVRSPGISSQPSPAVSETPMPRVSPSSIHTRSTSSRLSQAVKSMIPGAQRRNSSAALRSSPVDDNQEHTKDHQSPTRFLSMVVERRSTAAPPLPLPLPLPPTQTSEMLTRGPQVPPKKGSLVLQRARAYEQSNVNQPSGNRATLSSFTIPPLPQIPPMSELTEVVEKSRITFA